MEDNSPARTEFLTANFKRRCLIVTTLLLYGLLNLFWNFRTNDEGFILAQSWKIFHSQVPHLDFVTFRPALSGFIHCVWFFLPTGLQFLAARLSFFVWAALSALTADVVLTEILEADGALGGLESEVFVFFTILGGLWACHTFPPMPWYTFDGALLASLSIGALVHGFNLGESHRANRLKSWGWFIAAGTCAGLATWAKQNFALFSAGVLAAALFMNLRYRDLFRGVFFAALAGLCIPSLTAFAYLNHHGALKDFSSQMGEASVPQAAIQALFGPYLDLGPLRFLLSVSLGLTAGLATASAKKSCAQIRGIAAIALGGVAAGWIYDPDQLPRIHEMFLFLTASTGVLIYFMVRRERHRQPAVILAVFVALSFLLALASQVALVWVVPLPGIACFFAGLGALILRRASPTLRGINPKNSRRLKFGLALALTLVFGRFMYLCVESPLGDEPRSRQRYNLAKLFPKLGLLYTGEPNYRRFEKLLEISRDIPRSTPLVVMPEFPLFYYLTDRVNPVGQDWWLLEDYRSHANELWARINAQASLVILEVFDEGPTCTRPIYADAIERDVSQKFRMVKKVGPFCLFAVK